MAKPSAAFHEHRLAHVEVPEGEAEVEVRVRLLLVRQLDVEADRHAAARFRAPVRRRHQSGPAAGDDSEARLGEESPDLNRLGVDRLVLCRPRRAEDGHRGVGDVRDGVEPVEELVGDPIDVESLVRVGLEGEVVGHSRRNPGSDYILVCSPSSPRGCTPIGAVRDYLLLRPLGDDGNHLQSAAGGGGGADILAAAPLLSLVRFSLWAIKQAAERQLRPRRAAAVGPVPV